MSAPLWQPPPERIERARVTAFARRLEAEHRVRLPDHPALHRFSIEEPALFWQALFDDCGVLATRESPEVLVDGERLPGARWFPGTRLNFAENLLRRRDAVPALVFRSETGERRELSHRELFASVARLASALRAWGIRPGDRVAGYLPNLPEAIVAMLAAASVGAVWTSCSPDFGVPGVLERFGQIGPRVLFCADGHAYAGRRISSLERVAELRTALPSVERIVVVPHLDAAPDLAALPGALGWADALAPHAGDAIRFERLPFDHPLYILYSSGTTGAPKCIVHGAGGTLLQHLKEHRLHVDLGPEDRLFYFTTCGWMMWNWLASGLASGATLVLYDGSPFHPEPGALFDLAERERVTVFGTSAKFLDAAAKAGVEPLRSHDLAPLRTILSTGSPLAPESFDWVYARVKRDVALASISGGTDIVSCFVLGSPTLPVWRGEIQCAGLGMRVEVFDATGRAVRGAKGELVCTAPFPSVPLRFWNDPGDRRFHAAYFERFPGVWAHGDFAETTEHGGFVIHGRSDAVLNPGGVRIGTAEIYRPVERIPEVLESLAIGQEWQGDTRVVLFVRLREGLRLDAELADRIRARVRSEASPRHVPARIVQVPDIPRTRSGKIVELAVRDVVHGRVVRNREALANPEALELFRDLPELGR